MKKILLISDTHGYLDEKILKYCKSVDEVWHAGDVGNIIDFTSPLKMFDYMACGKIIISSNVKVLREVLKEKKTLYL